MRVYYHVEYFIAEMSYWAAKSNPEEYHTTVLAWYIVYKIIKRGI
jgi:hypothetical protein